MAYSDMRRGWAGARRGPRLVGSSRRRAGPPRCPRAVPAAPRGHWPATTNGVASRRMGRARAGLLLFRSAVRAVRAVRAALPTRAVRTGGTAVTVRAMLRLSCLPGPRPRVGSRSASLIGTTVCPPKARPLTLTPLQGRGGLVGLGAGRGNCVAIARARRPQGVAGAGACQGAASGAALARLAATWKGEGGRSPCWPRDVRSL